MGLLSDLNSKLTGSGKRDKWIVVARDSKGHAASFPDEIEDEDRRFYEEPVDKDTWEYEYGEYLDPGVKYYCVKTHEKGYDFQDPEWIIKNEQTETDRKLERLERKLDEDDDAQPADYEVDNMEQVRARFAQSLVNGLANDPNLGTDKKFALAMELISEDGQQDRDTWEEIVSGATNNMNIDTPRDVAMMMMMKELPDMTDQLKETMGNVNNLLGGRNSGGTPGDTVPVSNGQDNQDAAGREGGQSGEGGQANESDSGFNLDDYEDESPGEQADDTEPEAGEAEKWMDETEDVENTEMEPEPEPELDDPEPKESVLDGMSAEPDEPIEADGGEPDDE